MSQTGIKQNIHIDGTDLHACYWSEFKIYNDQLNMHRGWELYTEQAVPLK